MMRQWLVFDLDSTLVYEGQVVPFQQVPSLIDQLYRAGYQLFICSYNPAAYIVLRLAGLRKYFTKIRVVFNGGSKGLAIRQLAQSYNLDPQKCVFFDDLDSNVRDACQYGIRSVKVDPRVGATEWQVRTALIY